MRAPLLAGLLLLPLLSGCRDTPEASPSASSETADAAPDSRSIPFRIDGRLSFVRGTQTLRTIDIEVADTDSTRGRGLMERSVIPPDTGMLFVFDTAAPQSFYMASTPKSLDIQFYSADSTLINIAEDAVPYSFDNLSSEGPAQFVVEVPAGYSRRIGLVPGDKITWTLNRDAAGTAEADTSASASAE